jgi:hypothetical protein
MKYMAIHEEIGPLLMLAHYGDKRKRISVSQDNLVDTKRG